MPSGDIEGDLEQVTVLLAGLEITLTARRATGGYSASASGFELVGSEGGQTTRVETSSSPAPVPAGIEALSLEATSPAALASLPVPVLDSLVGQLRGSHELWAPRARLGRAFRAGVAAKFRLEGRDCSVSASPIPFKNSVYIVLRCPEYPQGFWTSSYQVYISKVGGRSGTLLSGSISHAFPSRAEATAFLAGASQSWPREL